MNIDTLPALDLEAGFSNTESEDAVASLAGLLGILIAAAIPAN